MTSLPPKLWAHRVLQGVGGTTRGPSQVSLWKRSMFEAAFAQGPSHKFSVELADRGCQNRCVISRMMSSLFEVGSCRATG